jgi:hypothetical protein
MLLGGSLLSMVLPIMNRNKTLLMNCIMCILVGMDLL